MTGSSHADPYGVLARRREAELVVEGRNAIDIDLWYIEKPGYLQHGMGRKISQLFLDFLQNGYEIFSLVL
jgi:hypothetical protein